MIRGCRLIVESTAATIRFFLSSILSSTLNRSSRKISARSCRQSALRRNEVSKILISNEIYSSSSTQRSTHCYSSQNAFLRCSVILFRVALHISVRRNIRNILLRIIRRSLYTVCVYRQFIHLPLLYFL